MGLAAKIGAGVVIAAILVLVASCEISIWNECRADHSWWYCMRVLNK